MGLIEQAARRLEELRRAGIQVPEAAPARDETPAPAIPGEAPQPERPGGPRVTLDLHRLSAEGYVTPDNPRSRIADEFRIVKRPLIANTTGAAAAPIRNANLIMVTSAVPGEGKTFSSINLAMSIAMELDRTVLLVDADVARSSLHRALGIPPLRGMLDVLVDERVDVGGVLVRTNVERFTFLASGTHHPRATELLASEAMSRLLEELAGRYPDRLIIFDSPPLLPTTEARVLATHMGQIVFVVGAERTLQSQVKQALATIEACPVKMILLNGARTSAQGAYGYGYGYGY